MQNRWRGMFQIRWEPFYLRPDPQFLLRTEDEKWENQRKPYIEELKEELKEIESSRLKNPAFVKFVLNKYPPKEK